MTQVQSKGLAVAISSSFWFFSSSFPLFQAMGLHSPLSTVLLPIQSSIGFLAGC